MLGTLDSSFIPMPLSAIRSNSSCELYLSGGELNHRSSEVSVYDSKFCNPNRPEVYCSIFESNSNETCRALTGSPLICDDKFAGILDTNGTCFALNSNQVYQNFYSIGDFQPWIDKVMQDNMQAYPFFVVQVLHYYVDIKDATFLCTGTIITRP
jgi:hypothetical protein